MNFLAHFLIVERLKGLMRPGGRIVTTSSEVHDPDASEIGRDRTWLQQLGWKYVMPLFAPILPGARGLGRSAGDLVWLITEADVAQLSGHTWTAGCRRRASRTIWRRSRGRWRWRVILGRFVEPVGSLAPD